MRHQYTPVFRDFTTSSMWAEDSDTRIVWLWMLLAADPEGYVPGAAPGIALAANVPLDKTRRALELLEAPDPDSRTKVRGGRRIEKVDHGWRIINFVSWRERAKQESAKARKRHWASRQRDVANDNDGVQEPSELDDPRRDVDFKTPEVDARPQKVDAPKPIPKPTPTPEGSGSGSPLPPGVFEAPSQQTVLHELPDDWEPSEELRADAAIAGVKNLDHWISKLRLIRIGGQGGVLAHKLDGWVRLQFGTWKTWEETDRAKDAQRSASGGPSSRFGKGGGALVGPEPGERHRAFAAQHGLSLDEAVKACVEKNYTRDNYGPKDLATALERQLLAMMRAREASA